MGLSCLFVIPVLSSLEPAKKLLWPYNKFFIDRTCSVTIPYLLRNYISLLALEQITEWAKIAAQILKAACRLNDTYIHTLLARPHGAFQSQ